LRARDFARSRRQQAWPAERRREKSNGFADETGQGLFLARARMGSAKGLARRPIAPAFNMGELMAAEAFG
jgi:hypothetical protein